MRQLLAARPGLAIVYVPTRNTADALAQALWFSGHRSAPYHAGLARERRAEVLERFIAEELDVVVATSAFGMGIDAPRVRLVVHWGMPATPEAYYQEAGRAGRDGHPARCVLLYHPSDPGIHGSVSKRPEPVVGRGRVGYECTISVDDLGAIRTAIVANGGKIIMEEYEIVGVGRLIRFEDSEGNVACAMRYA